ncbi:thioesterase II family protein [Nocardia sp. NPDC049149]|uniref:thioesterase II family protein n=1 Tax=Nocardia sp. NPDC049149 TaxID=3364315 RepID=UPI00370FB6DA
MNSAISVDTEHQARWIRAFHPAPTATLRLICFPHAGGSAVYYRPLARALSLPIEVRAVQYPGRQDRMREPFIDDIRELAEQVALALPPDGVPTMFFGHSMGATVAFEVARRWERLGHSPIRLFVSGRRAPSLRADYQIPLATDDDVLTEIRRLAGTDDRLLAEDDLLRMIIPAVRNDYRAVETYLAEPEAVVSCPTVAMRGTQDPRVSGKDIEKWRGHTSGAFALHSFGGGHFYLEQRWDQVAALVERHVSFGACAA